jgi:hypothetical protein
MKEEKSLEKIEIPTECITRLIFLVRGRKVMFDRDLAELYGVDTKVLNQAVKRNFERFPEDFMFKLNKQETKAWRGYLLRSQFVTLKQDPNKNKLANLRSQIVTSSLEHGGHRYSPYVFTELGVSMLSSVLKSDRAVQINIFIMRTFVKLRQMIIDNKELASKFNSLELDQLKQGITLTKLYKYVKEFMDTPIPLEGKLGFNVEK